ncbi:MAG TPA: hypothetical protein VG167_01680 [Verrucomicrobiae bacterium]|nr:hypothetical protein [Verrucomicrobiae bacterium]
MKDAAIIDTLQAGHLFLAIADASENLLEVSFVCERAAGVNNAHRGVEFRRCGSGSLIDIYLEVETSEGFAYCWWITVRFDASGWSVLATVSKTENAEQRIIQELCEFKGSEVHLFLLKMKEACRLVVESASSFEFKKRATV